MRLTTAVIVMVGASCSTAMAAQALPILAGRYANDACTPSRPSSTRIFKAGSTSTSTEDCSIAIKSVDGNVYHAHLTCRYRQASDAEDDVVLKIDSPASVTWINQCMAVRYHFCGPAGRNP